ESCAVLLRVFANWVRCIPPTPRWREGAGGKRSLCLSSIWDPESETGSRSFSDSYLEMGDVCLGRRVLVNAQIAVPLSGFTFPGNARLRRLLPRPQTKSKLAPAAAANHGLDLLSTRCCSLRSLGLRKRPQGNATLPRAGQSLEGAGLVLSKT